MGSYVPAARMGFPTHLEPIFEAEYAESTRVGIVIVYKRQMEHMETLCKHSVTRTFIVSREKSSTCYLSPVLHLSHTTAFGEFRHLAQIHKCHTR